MNHPKTILPVIALVITGCAGRSSCELPPTHTTTTDASTADTSTIEASIPDTPQETQPDRPTPPLPSPEQKIMFEMSYSNFAWGTVFSGMYITSDGSVFQYDYRINEPGSPIPYTKFTHSMTEAQITEKHGSTPKKIATVDLQEMQTQWGLSYAAANGALLVSSNCRDYGLLNFVAYHYDPQLKTYSAILLKGIGDAGIKNTAPAADELVEWLQTVAKFPVSENCQYGISMVNCDVSPCEGAPDCQNGKILGQQPSESCANTCVWPHNCAHVSDCSDCGRDPCVIDLEGKRHCNVRNDCEEKSWKDCQCDDSICAGGLDYCTKQQSGELICHAKLLD